MILTETSKGRDRAIEPCMRRKGSRKNIGSRSTCRHLRKPLILRGGHDGWKANKAASTLLDFAYPLEISDHEDFLRRGVHGLSLQSVIEEVRRARRVPPTLRDTCDVTQMEIECVHLAIDY